MRVRRRVIGLAALALGAVVGIALWWMFRVPAVPRADGGSCTVKLGARDEQVRMACGEGDVPKGGCGSSRAGQVINLCSNRCDVYRDVAVCYSGSEVVEVERLPAAGILAQPCSW